ncbi:hypothetical protein [Polaribacter atrinae]|uniref:Lipoprotein n=1 Tax=Polaribacter atrinae TaxID=1333662 RepID=A0A176TCZ8_9FLAO|nr:hypothetical protein [Polaribacter atrinae]OAD45788.1 hypothetical protein LPB303_05740 [Polaribacter atrinae]
MKQTIYLLLSVILFSCGNKKQETISTLQETPKLSIPAQHISVEDVKPIYEKEIEDWQELKMVNSFIKKFGKVSPNEALSNALELRDLVISLKDSVKPEIFDNPPFQTRINVLHNEVLRLADLTFIPAITSEEVNYQVDKTIAAFSTVNSKINSILAKKRFEEEIDLKFDFIGIDSTQMDSISKKSILLKRQEEDSIKKEELINPSPGKQGFLKKEL